MHVHNYMAQGMLKFFNFLILFCSKEAHIDKDFVNHSGEHFVSAETD